MQIIHPQVPMNGLPVDDVFIVVDDAGNELGMGWMIYQYQPHLYPDCPVNLYFSMDCQPAARYMLFGALMARARQLRDYNIGDRARVYTDLNAEDTRNQEFYLQSGLNIEDTEDILQLPIPPGDGRIPMSCTVASVPLNTMDEQAAFVSRMQQNDISWVNQDYLNVLAGLPHFHALGLYRNADLIGEILMAGQGAGCELVGMYIIPGCRMQGMGRALLHRSMAIMAAEGVTMVSTRVMSRSLPQKRLMADFAARKVGTSTVYPGLYL